jgi:hypothetical protein
MRTALPGTGLPSASSTLPVTVVRAPAAATTTTRESDTTSIDEATPKSWRTRLDIGSVDEPCPDVPAPASDVAAARTSAEKAATAMAPAREDSFANGWAEAKAAARERRGG